MEPATGVFIAVTEEVSTTDSYRTDGVVSLGGVEIWRKTDIYYDSTPVDVLREFAEHLAKKLA